MSKTRFTLQYLMQHDGLYCTVHALVEACYDSADVVERSNPVLAEEWRGLARALTPLEYVADRIETLQASGPG